MLNTIIRNLFSNAIKFTLPRGKIIIAAENYKTIGLKKGRNTKNKEIKISVIDNGIGIRNEDFKKLFRLDVNFSTKGTENEQGTGLGLILCKEFVGRHNGKIWAVNNKDIEDSTCFKSGCNISFTLPEWV